MELESAVRPRSNGTYALVERRARLILADETELPFPIWSTGARQVAASLQAGRFNPNAVLDESQVTLVSARDGKVIATAEVVDPALRLRAAPTLRSMARHARTSDRATRIRGARPRQSHGGDQVFFALARRSA